MFGGPQTGWRQIAVTAPRTEVEFAHHRQWLVEERYPKAEVSRGVLDTLSTPKPASLSEAFAPQEARRRATTVEFHSPPQHGRWLNRAEIAWRILARQGVARRSPDEAPRTQSTRIKPGAPRSEPPVSGASRSVRHDANGITFTPHL